MLPGGPGKSKKVKDALVTALKTALMERHTAWLSLTEAKAPSFLLVRRWRRKEISPNSFATLSASCTTLRALSSKSFSPPAAHCS